MQQVVHKLILVSFLGIFSLSPAHALLSSGISLSGGYYQDYGGKARTPLFLYWNLNHTTNSGVESFFDVGLNNNLLGNVWGAFVYQGYVTVPLSQGFDNAPYKKSRIQLGRQLLTEGFEFNLLDGIQVPYYLNEHTGLSLVAGGVPVLAEKVVDFSAQILGATVHTEALKAPFNIHLKGGYHHKRKKYEATTANLLFASALLPFEHVPWEPQLFVKAQSDITHPTSPGIRWIYADTSVSPLSQLQLGATFTKTEPSPLDARDTQFIYRLFAIAPQQLTAGYANVAINEDFRLQGNYRLAQYQSPQENETENEQEVSLMWMHARSTFTPSFYRVASYGGTATQIGLSYRRDVSETTSFRAQVSAANISKINSINFIAYNLRGGIDLRLGSRLMLALVAEAERNHQFLIDGRLEGFLQYYLF